MAVGMGLLRNGVVWKVLLEPLVLGILVGLTAALFPIADGDLKVSKRSGQFFQPIGVYGIAVTSLG